MGKKKVTIDVIAAAAGVSKTTVSRYLNGRTDLMSKETAKKISNIIQLSDYHPSEYARALKNSRTKMIGIIVSDILSPWTSAFIGGCEEILSGYGYSALFLNSNNSLEREKELVASLKTRGVEGLIVNPVSYLDPYLMKYSLSDTPLVICDRLIKDYPFNAVLAGIREPIYKLVAHLKDEGFTRPVIFSLTKHENYARMIRVKTFKEAMLATYGRCDDNDVFQIKKDDPDEVFVCLKDFLQRVDPKEKVAVLCVNTITTLRVFSAIQRLNLSIPNDIGICGQDDWCWDDSIRLPTLLYPEITTINIDSHEIGRQCANMVMRIISGEVDRTGCEVIDVPCSLSIRASTKRH